MKKLISVLVVLGTLACSVFAAGNRKAIDDFFKEYEAFVVKAEKAAESNKISDLTNLSLESVKLAEACDKIDDTDAWTLDDSAKYLKLTNRYSAAVSKLSEATTSTAVTTDDYDALLKAYGF